MSQLDHKVNFETVAELEMILENTPGDYDQLVFQLPALIEETDELRAALSALPVDKAKIKRELVDVLVLCYAITATMGYEVEQLPITQPPKDLITSQKVSNMSRSLQQIARNSTFIETNRNNYEIHNTVNKLLAIASYHDIDLQETVVEYMVAVKSWHDKTEKDAIETWSYWEDQGATCVIRKVTGLVVKEAYIVLASDNCMVNGRFVYEGKWLKSIKRKLPEFTDS